MVEPTHLKNMSQIGSFPQVEVKMKHIWNHHLDKGAIIKGNKDIIVIAAIAIHYNSMAIS